MRGYALLEPNPLFCALTYLLVVLTAVVASFELGNRNVNKA